MFNLVSSEIYKWRKTKGFWGCLLSGAGLVALIFLMLKLADGIQTGQIDSGTMGVVVSGEVINPEETESIFEEIGILDIIQGTWGGGGNLIFLTIFVCIWIIGEYTNGAVKNIIGKGYLRSSIFFVKYIFAILLSLLMNIVFFAVAIIGGIVIAGVEQTGGTFWQDCMAYIGVQLMLGMAFAGIVAAISEFARNMAAGIGIGMGLIVFSAIVISGFDFILQAFHIHFKLSTYWVMNAVTECQAGAVSMDFVGRSVCVTVIWILIPMLAGMLHFHRSDI